MCHDQHDEYDDDDDDHVGVSQGDGTQQGSIKGSAAWGTTKNAIAQLKATRQQSALLQLQLLIQVQYHSSSLLTTSHH